MTALAAVRQHNKEELSKFSEFLNMMPKTILMYSVSYALYRATKPAKGNFHPVRKNGPNTFVSGDRIVHDSSNAAYNWRTSYSGEKGYVNFKGISPVGDAYSKRSTNDRGSAVIAAVARHGEELSKMYNTFFTGVQVKAKTVTLYNPISGVYADHANIAATMGPIMTAAYSGESIASLQIQNYMSSGAKGAPNSKGLLAQISEIYGRL